MLKISRMDESTQMDATSGYLIQADISRNLIEVRYRGRVTAAVVKAVHEEVLNLLPQMRQGLTFDCPAIVSWVSRWVTLVPGDLIYTGTPGTTRAMQRGLAQSFELSRIHGKT